MLWAAMLAALLSLAPQSLMGQDKTIKRKVAIGRFSNETQYAKGIFYDKDNDPMRKQALDILSSKLALSGKFILLEREDLDVLMHQNPDSGSRREPASGRGRHRTHHLFR